MNTGARQQIRTPLVKAEQAIALYGDLETAINKSGLPARLLQQAWKRLHAAAEHTEGTR